MSDISIFRRHRDFFWALAVSIGLFSLSITEILDISGVIGLPVIAGFIGVMTGIVSFIVVFQQYSDVIDRAKEEEMMGIIEMVFKYPLISSVAGLALTVIIKSASLEVSIQVIQRNLVLINGLIYSSIIFLLMYSILSFFEGVWFLYRVMIGQSGTAG